MKKRILTLLLCLTMVASLFGGCGKKNSSSKSSEKTYRLLYASEISTLNYLTTSTTNDFKLSANLIDTLVEYDPYGNIKPSLATDWKISEDGLTYTFHIRKGQKWVDYSGKEIADVTANDFVSAMKYILTPEYESNTAKLLFGIIANAQEFYNKTITDFTQVGVKATDEDTLVYTLVDPCPFFLSSLTYVTYMPAYGPKLDELGSGFGAATGPDTLYYCGAYRLSEFRPQEKRVLVKNESYWEANQVHIARIEETYNAEATTIAPIMALRGEVDFALISSDIVDEWLNDLAKREMISKARLKTDYSYFFSFNFDPKFDDIYEPDNWKIAVNNENFRQAMMAALDRIKALSVAEPNKPELLLLNTVTPNSFVRVDGKDFTDYGELAVINKRDSFQPIKALQYKDKARKELAKQGATFPIRVLMKYRADSTNWASECTVIEQQMEHVLGSDFIDIIVEAGPSENFLSETRRNGNYAFMKCNWGADYADPNTFTDPFQEENTYNFMITSVKEENGAAKEVSEYLNLLAVAKEQKTDLNARYEAYAKAEAYLIQHAFVIPYSVESMDYQVTKLNVFEGPYASFGVSIYRYKGQTLYDQPITMDQFNSNLNVWEDALKAR